MRFPGLALLFLFFASVTAVFAAPQTTAPAAQAEPTISKRQWSGLHHRTGAGEYVRRTGAEDDPATKQGVRPDARRFAEAAEGRRIGKNNQRDAGSFHDFQR